MGVGDLRYRVTPDAGLDRITSYNVCYTKLLRVDIGAEIVGVDLSRPLSEQQRAEIWDAFLTWKVIFFRDQT